MHNQATSEGYFNDFCIDVYVMPTHTCYCDKQRVDLNALPYKMLLDRAVKRNNYCTSFSVRSMCLLSALAQVFQGS